MNLSRRDFIKHSTALGAACSLPIQSLKAFEADQIITRAIPKTGETVPIVGLGSSASFRTVAQSEDYSALTEVLQTMVDNRGTVFDTAPGYGVSEEVSGQIARDNNLTNKIFWATKVNVVRRGSSEPADEAEARAQIHASFDRIDRDPMDLIQVHNLAGLPTQMGIIKEMKEDGKIRYIGTTSTNTQRYGDLEKAMHDYPIDFIGVDYAIDNQVSAERILPLAREKGIAVLIYVPFGRNRLFSAVGDRPIPEWAKEYGIDTWGKFFIKYVAAHPAVTCVTPATSKARHMLDNMGASYGELPDAATLKRMEQFIEDLA